MQEITYLEPEKIKASGLTEEEVKHIASVSDKHMLSMVSSIIWSYEGISLILSLAHHDFLDICRNAYSQVIGVSTSTRVREKSPGPICFLLA